MPVLTPITNVPQSQDMILLRGTTLAPSLIIYQYTPAATFGGTATSAAYPIPNHARILFIVQPNILVPASTAPLLQKDNQSLTGVTVTNAATGLITVSFNATDLLDPVAFPEDANQYYAVKLFVGTNPEQIVIQGAFVVTSSIVSAT
jgi:hypothetical protein